MKFDAGMCMVNFRLSHLHALHACGVIPLHSIRFNMPFDLWKINKPQFFYDFTSNYTDRNAQEEAKHNDKIK